MMISVRMFALCLLAAQVLFAEGSYGLNKVQYDPFDWKMVRTAHFDLYYYQGGDSLAAYLGHEIETIYAQSAEFLDHRLQQRIPIILHNSHAQFEQTNVIRFPIPEAVGGFTEVFKNRIVLPFDGSYTNFHHVVQHELLHAMVFDLVSNGRRGYSTAAKLGEMPLWMNEGNSELGSLGWDLGSEFFLLDAVTNGYVRNPSEDLWGYLAYKGGQSFLYFVESTWGTGTVAKIFRSISRGIPFHIAFLRATRVSLDEAGEIWLREIRRIFWPELGQRKYAKSIARAMTDHRKDESFYNVNPVLSPDGRRIAFFSDRGNWEAVYILDTETEQITRTAIEGGHRASHESFHPFNSALAWAADNRHLALVGKQSGRDVVHIVDTEESEVVCTIEAKGLEAMWSPGISPDGTKIVVSGQRNSIQDLYLLNLPAPVGSASLKEDVAVEPRRLTEGRATDERPVFSPSGQYIAFQSNLAQDPRDRHIKDKLDVYVLRLENLDIRRVTQSRWSSHSPAFGEDDSLIVYVSNRSGVDNLYMQNTFGDSLWPITNVLSAVSSPSWSRDGNSIAFSLFEEGGWDVFLMKDPWKHRHLQPLPLSRFIQVAEDTTGTQKYFEKIELQNLKTFKSQSSMDSLEAEIRDRQDQKPTGAPSPVPVSLVDEEESFFIGDVKKDGESKPDSAKVDSAKADSARVGATRNNITEADTTDSLEYARSDIAPGWDPPDTSNIFLSGGKELVFHEDGSLRVTPYKTQWSLDQAVAVAGFSSVGGVGGEGALTFSDLMGDQEVSLWFFGGGSFTDINLYVDYGYLPLRPDFHVSGFHLYNEGVEEMSEAKLSRIHDSIPAPGSDTVWGYVPYGDRTVGTQLSVAMPLSLYSRFNVGTQLSWRSRTWKTVSDAKYDGWGWNYDLKDDSLATPEHINTVDLLVSWTFDNAQWGISGPVEGERLWAGVRGIPPGLLQDRYAYWRTDADMRKYFRVFQRYTFAFRLAGGMSEPIKGYENPHRYLLGGDEWTINWNINQDHWRGTQEDVFFSSWETPLRGFRYNDFEGTRMGVANVEFRFPFIDRLSFGWPIPLSITNVTGVLFTDVGGAWDNQETMEERGWGFGWGWRLNLGIFVLRYTRAWSVREFSTVRRNDYTYWSLGAEF